MSLELILSLECVFLRNVSFFAAPSIKVLDYKLYYMEREAFTCTLRANPVPKIPAGNMKKVTPSKRKEDAIAFPSHVLGYLSP